MVIQAKIENQEYDFEFVPSAKENDLTTWVGKPIGYSNTDEKIEVCEENGIINKISATRNISTPKNILLERALAAFIEIRETQQMGVEEENKKQVNLGIITPFDPEKIKVRTMTLSAFEMHRLIKKKKIDLNPDFQRNFVWDDTRKSRLIESMMLKIPLPAFYFAEDKSGNYQVIDGLQRLSVISTFFENTFKLKNLEYLSEKCNGKFYCVDPDKGIFEKDILDENLIGRIETTQLSINVIEPTSPDTVKYDIFYRINTGGRPLNNQEIRNCFASPTVRELLKRMSENKSFTLGTGESISDTRMDAQELCLRFLSFYLFKSDYKGNMNSFLDLSLEKLNVMNKEIISNAESRFYNGLNNSYHLFGKYAFRKCFTEHIKPNARKQLINKSMFITWNLLLCELDSNKVHQLQTESLAIEVAKELDKRGDFYFALTSSTTDISNIELTEKISREILNTHFSKNSISL